MTSPIYQEHDRMNEAGSSTVAAQASWLTAALVVACVIFLVGADRAHAAFGLVPGSFSSEAFQDLGETTVESQAGAHPFVYTTRFALNMRDNGSARPIPDGNIRDSVVDLPPGLVGNPKAAPTCELSDLRINGPSVGVPRPTLCPVDSQVGTALIQQDIGLRTFLYKIPVYNLVPNADEIAAMGFNLVNVPVRIVPKVRTDGDYGLEVAVRDANQTLAVSAASVSLWGVPADPAHDADRGIFQLSLNGGPPITPTPGGLSSSVPRRPFLTLPFDCARGALSTRLGVRSWQEPEAWSTATHVSPAGVTGCERLRFEPTVDVSVSSTRPDSPTGLDFDLALPYNDNPVGIGNPPLRDVSVTLPEGMTISPSSADGLGACSDAQVGLGSRSDSSCPPSSKIGTVVAETPVLDEPLAGSVYVGTQQSSDPESGEMFRLFLVLRGRGGLVVKLEGAIVADAETGRLETRFVDNPQLPVSRIRLSLKSGPRAPLATPPACGVKSVDVHLESWGGQVADIADSLTIDCPSGGTFAPAFAAGAMSPTGGAFSPFVARIDRNDGEGYLSRVSVDLPQGVLAKLSGVALCPEAVAGDGTPGVCPEASRIGTATVAAGPGAAPFHLSAGVYLTGPYNGGAYGATVQVHAKAGPFDLGWVKVRNSLVVDRKTAEVTVASDALPQIVKGVPVRLRSVDVDVDRPDFTVNPTSCDEKRIEAALSSIHSQVHATGSRFQVGDCAALPFKPRLGLRLTGKRQRVTGRHPGVRAVVRQSGVGEAGIDRARVVLPKSLALDPENAQALCEFEDGTRPDLESHCPKGSIVGRARAKTPLLNEDLVGDVYFVKNVKRSKTGNLIRTLPMIVVALRGEIAINLVGKSSTTRAGKLVNTFASVPDAPITRFNLNIKGGKTGILAVTRTRRARINLCAKPRGQIASNRMNGHNGKRAAYRVRVKTPCGKKTKAGKRGKAKRNR